MSLIERLTQEQESQLPIYRNKWLKIGLATEPGKMDVNRIRDVLGDVYRAGNLEPPLTLIELPSPLHGTVGASMLAQVGDQVGAQVGAQVRDQVGAQVRAQVRDQVWDQVRDQVGAQAGAQVYRCGYGNHDANWLGFYQFFGDQYGLEICNRLSPLMHLAEQCGWWWPFEKACIITPRPSAIHRNTQGQLHNDGGPALDYNGHFRLWRLNGVRVPQWLAEQCDSEIDPKRITEFGNAEARREFVRKIGVERIWHALSPKVLDEKTLAVGGVYSLADLDVGNGMVWRCLKMQNPSVPEVWHIERVPPECKTVHEALNARNGLTEDMIDDENGADWYQQGDVILRPSEETKFKQLPKVLT